MDRWRGASLSALQPDEHSYDSGKFNHGNAKFDQHGQQRFEPQGVGRQSQPSYGSQTLERKGQNGSQSLERPAQQMFGPQSVERPAQQPYGSQSNERPVQQPYGSQSLERPNQQPYGSQSLERPVQQPYGSQALERPNQQPFGSQSIERPAQKPYGSQSLERPTQQMFGSQSIERPNKHGKQPYGSQSLERPNQQPFGSQSLARPNQQPYGSQSPNHPAYGSQILEQKTQPLTQQGYGVQNVDGVYHESLDSHPGNFYLPKSFDQRDNDEGTMNSRHSLRQDDRGAHRQSHPESSEPQAVHQRGYTSQQELGHTSSLQRGVHGGPNPIRGGDGGGVAGAPSSGWSPDGYQSLPNIHSVREHPDTAERVPNPYSTHDPHAQVSPSSPHSPSHHAANHRQSSPSSPSRKSNGYLSLSHRESEVREASQIVELLRQRAVLLTGGRDRRGGPVLTFPHEGAAEDLSPDDTATCIKYLAIIPCEDSASKGFSVLIDNRQTWYRDLKTLFKIIQHSLGGSIVNAVLVLVSDKQKFTLSFRKDKTNYGFEVKELTPSKLFPLISPNQLTPDLGGNLAYDHTFWLENRILFEKYMKESKMVSNDLQRTYAQIVERLRNDDTITPQDLLQQHRYLQESVIHVPEKTIQKGRDLHRQLQIKSKTGFRSLPVDAGDDDNVYTLDRVTAMDSIKRAVEQLEGQLDLIQELWKERQWELGRKMHLSELETAMKTIVDWILGPAERLLASQTEIGDSYKSADLLRKQHEQLELKCTDTYGTYAELRHKAAQILKEGGTKAADIEAQREFMDMVCRSYAARLERRRNLIITSVRFHRLIEELQTKLSELDDLLRAADVNFNDLDSAKKALEDLKEKVEDTKTHAEHTFREGQNLLDQLSLPVKNAFGQDVTADMRPQIEHVQRLLEKLQQNKVKADELTDVRVIKLQQIIQLLMCDQDADQAITWLHELSGVIQDKQLDVINRPHQDAQQQYEQKQVETTALTTYDYGKQYIQTALKLRRSLGFDLEPCQDRSRRLNIAWKKFSQGVDERASRLDTAATFNKRADEVLDHIEQLLVVISQVVNMEITVDQLVMQHSQEYRALQRDHNDTTQLGQELINTLTKPILVQHGTERIYEVTDDGLAELIRGKLDVVHMKMAQLDQNWSVQTQGIQLDQNGQLLGPDGQPRRRRRVTDTKSTETTNRVIEKTHSSLTRSAPPPPPRRQISEQIDPRWTNLMEQLKKVLHWNLC